MSYLNISQASENDTLHKLLSVRAITRIGYMVTSWVMVTWLQKLGMLYKAHSEFFSWLLKKAALSGVNKHRNERNEPEWGGMDRNGPEWAGMTPEWTGMNRNEPEWHRNGPEWTGMNQNDTGMTPEWHRNESE